jgi:hypothetical protein
VPSSKSDIADLVGESPSFQRREWRVDRVGWVVMALILVAGLVGVWGAGVHTATIDSDSGDPVRLWQFVYP